MAYYRIALSIALALLFGAKASAQEWEHSCDFSSDTVFYQYHDVYELNSGSIIVKGVVSPHITSASCWVDLLLLTPDGNLVAHNELFKPAFWNYNMHFLTNADNELFVLTSYSPDHDYESPNYFMNFDTVPDYAILGLYKLDDNLQVVRSMEHQIPVDTFEMRGHDWWELSKNMCSGYIWPISAFVDNDGYIVGNCVKAISFGHEDIAKDTIVVFRMDFEGNLITKKDIPCVKTSGDLHPLNFTARSGNMVKANDSTYVMYDVDMGMFGLQGNVIYLDRDFNVTLIRRITNPGAFDLYAYQWPSIVRSPYNTTYISATISENDKNTYGIRLYEYNDSEGVGYMHPVRYIKRNYSWDHSALHRGLDIAEDETIYFAYTLNVGLCGCLDSWMMIERLDRDFDTISTMYYDINGDTDIHSRAYGIKVLSDGGILLVSISHDINNTTQRWTTVTKFPAEAFVGIEEAHANGLRTAVVYPNPGQDVLNIHTGLKNAYVEVYDASGRQVHSHALTGGVTTIHAEAWPVGMYVWKVYADGREAESGRWVKE